MIHLILSLKFDCELGIEIGYIIDQNSIEWTINKLKDYLLRPINFILNK